MTSKNRHTIKNLKIEKKRIIITIDNNEHSFNLKEVSFQLYNATDSERLNFVISPSGYGIHWPLLDEDLSIDALLGIKHMPKRLPKKAA